MEYREERDSMGVLMVPADAYYGAQTQRAVENFPISGMLMPGEFISALARIKRFAAQTNRDLGLLDTGLAEAVIHAADDVLAGRLADQFVVDVFQTGSGTSTNMNVNEVLAGRANEILTGKRGGKSPVHPNDHVNLGQSSNDVIPTAIHVAALSEIRFSLVPAMKRLHSALDEKAAAFKDIRKLGRTHLQDAVPMTLGQEFSGYARQAALGVERLDALTPRLAELALGGTAVGTGLNTHPGFAAGTIEKLAVALALPFREAANHFAAQAAQDTAVEASGALKAIAVSLVKIANDVRWLASGPRSGLGEITIPSLQPGSSIMPGKINPVVPEAVIQVAAQVIGNDAAITMGGQNSAFELNMALPLIAHNLLQSIMLLSRAAGVFCDRCIVGIQANQGTCEGYIEKSLALVTGFVPHLGYDRAAEVAKTALVEGKTVREVVTALGTLSDAVIIEVLGPEPEDGS
ncbi:MAG: class II fumarate hydratase [Pseudomonadota bacterium]